MNQNKSAATGKGMYWTGVVMSVIPSLMLLMASVMSLSKSAQALQGMAQFGYPENTITAMGAACLVSTVLYIIPRTAVLGADLAHRLSRRRGRDASARRGGEIDLSHAGRFRRIDLGRALFSRRAHSESAPLEEIEIFQVPDRAKESLTFVD